MYSLSLADRLITLMEADESKPVPPSAIQEMRDAIVGPVWTTPAEREAAQILLSRLALVKHRPAHGRRADP